MMTIIYSTKPENKSGFILLLMSLGGLFLAFGYGSLLLDCSKISDIVIVSLILLSIGTWIYYILDEAIWQMFGKEKCEYNDKCIIITKHRIFKSRKVILWSEITNISLYTPTKIWEIITFFSLSGTSQDTILFRYRKGKKYKCGANLNRIQAQRAIRLLVNKNPIIKYKSQS